MKIVANPMSPKKSPSVRAGFSVLGLCPFQADLRRYSGFQGGRFLISCKTKPAEAIRYALSRRGGLTLFVGDGGIELLEAPLP
jgi:hypothetical protein